jgi:3-hydroxyisobutyrate dehydrogenase-like beta-hydroxyacid dehydrogenase
VYHPAPHDLWRWTHTGLAHLFRTNAEWTSVTVRPGAGTAATVAMSDALALCDALGIDHQLFTKVLADGPLAMPYAQQKAVAMDAHAYAAGFAIELARKDLSLAAHSATPSLLLRAVQQRLDQAIADGHGHDDLAAIDYQRRRN